MDAGKRSSYFPALRKYNMSVSLEGLSFACRTNYRVAGPEGKAGGFLESGFLEK